MVCVHVFPCLVGCLSLSDSYAFLCEVVCGFNVAGFDRLLGNGSEHAVGTRLSGFRYVCA